MAIQYMTSTLTLHEEGFTSWSVWTGNLHKWTEIDSADGFMVVMMRVYGFIPVNRMAGWKFSKSYPRTKILRAFTRTLVGYETHPSTPWVTRLATPPDERPAYATPANVPLA